MESRVKAGCDMWRLDTDLRPRVAHTECVSADPTTNAAADGDGEGGVGCWCCGATDLPSRMVQLGNHPEVYLCLRCAHFVHQQAWQIEDEVSSRPTALVRDRVRILRAVVIRRGWHRSRFVGGGLRWLGRYLP